MKVNSKSDACISAMDGMEMPCTLHDVVAVAVRRFGPMTSVYGNPIGIQDVHNALINSKKYTTLCGGRIVRKKGTGVEGEMGKLKDAQSHIDGVKIAKIIREFQCEFSDIYPERILEGIGVGPLQALIGLAIKNGHLKEPKA